MRDVLFLSHCVPNPPDKGEKIRAYHEVRELARAHRVHVVCFARSPREMEQARELQAWCASVHVELVHSLPCLAQAALAFAAGSSLNFGFYKSAAIERHVRNLCVDCAVVYSVVMAQFVPKGMPFLLDMVDVDSQKWLTFGESRFPRWFFRTEAARLRRREVEEAHRAKTTFLATGHERDLFRGFAGDGLAVDAIENGIDGEHYNPAITPLDPALVGRSFVVFTGAFHSYANIDGAVWFVKEIFPPMQRAHPGLELFLVGMNPSASVLRLQATPGVTVTGYVADTRPYLLSARAVVAPLRVARGIQNKVLEGLAMGRRVLVTGEVAKTFGTSLPAGLTVCASEHEWTAALSAPARESECEIRNQVLERFSWGHGTTRLSEAVRSLR